MTYVLFWLKDMILINLGFDMGVSFWLLQWQSIHAWAKAHLPAFWRKMARQLLLKQFMNIYVMPLKEFEWLSEALNTPFFLLAL